MKPKNLPAAIKTQSMLSLTVAREVEIDGVQMGVMSDGTAYLTGRGLAAMCGVVHSVIQDLTNDWESEQSKPRGIVIANLLHDAGYEGPLFIPINVDGSIHFAYPDVVCTALLEYYAFEAKPTRETALKNYRLLARSSLRAFIYVQVGYDPTNRIPECWKKFHDRVSLIHPKVPAGYFIIFKEMAADISVGIHWGNYWKEIDGENKHGQRIKYEHNYPDYFPQSASNPQHPWAYPDAALPNFRAWMRKTYLAEKLPDYLEIQEKKRGLPPSIRSLILEAVVPQAQIP